MRSAFIIHWKQWNKNAFHLFLTSVVFAHTQQVFFVIVVGEREQRRQMETKNGISVIITGGWTETVVTLFPIYKDGLVSDVNVLFELLLSPDYWSMTFDLFPVDFVSGFGLVFTDRLYCLFLVFIQSLVQGRCCFIEVVFPTAVHCDVMMMSCTTPVFLSQAGTLSLGCSSRSLKVLNGKCWLFVTWRL